MLKRFRKKEDQLVENIYLPKVKTGSVLAVYKLFNRYYLKSFFGPFFMFLFPVLIYAILGSFLDYKLMFAGAVGLTTIAPIVGIPTAILRLKFSVLLKRIGASPIKSWTFTLVIISYFGFAMFLSIFWLMLWALILHRDLTMFDFLTNTRGFFTFFYGVILSISITVSIGFLIGAISKSDEQGRVIAMLIMFMSQFLSGVFFSIDVIAGSPAMNWISRLIPYRYSTMYLVSTQIPGANPFVFNDLQGLVSLSDKAIFELGQQTPIGQTRPLFEKVTFYQNWEIIVAYIYPWLVIGLCNLVSTRKFSWSNSR